MPKSELGVWFDRLATAALTAILIFSLQTVIARIKIYRLTRKTPFLGKYALGQGILDVAFNREVSLTEFKKSLSAIQQNITDVGRQAAKYTTRILELKKGSSATAIRKIHKLATIAAKDISKTSQGIEPNLKNLEESSAILWRSILQAAKQTDADQAEASRALGVFSSLPTTMKDVHEKMETYRKSAKHLRTISMAFNAVSDELSEQADRILVVLDQSSSNCAELIELLQLKLPKSDVR